MKFVELITPENPQNKNLSNRIIFYKELVKELEVRLLPDEIIENINIHLIQINEANGSEKEQLRAMQKAQSAILSLLEKELKLVCHNHYRNLWLAIGMAVFGIPMGVIFGLSLDNMAFIGIGLPIGMSIGLALGTHKDNKAKAEGKQLDIEALG